MMNLLLTLFSLNFIVMPSLITVGNELIRINPSNNKIECSTNQGRTWSSRYTGSSCGQFVDLLLYGTEIIAVTDKESIAVPIKAAHGVRATQALHAALS